MEKDITVEKETQVLVSLQWREKWSFSGLRKHFGLVLLPPADICLVMGHRAAPDRTVQVQHRLEVKLAHQSAVYSLRAVKCSSVNGYNACSEHSLALFFFSWLKLQTNYLLKNIWIIHICISWKYRPRGWSSAFQTGVLSSGTVRALKYVKSFHFHGLSGQTVAFLLVILLYLAILCPYRNVIRFLFHVAGLK